jgi:integral membrane protein
MLNNSIGRLRIIGILEGISLLVLMGIAMPLKYFAGNPEPVRITGWIHGVLFMLFMLAVLVVFFQRRWPFRMLVFAFLAAFFPFGTFIFDRYLRKQEPEQRIS